MWKRIVTSLFGSRAASAASANNYSTVRLRRFASPGFGVVLSAPETWEDTSSTELFRVLDRPNDVAFTASGYSREPTASLEHFASARISVVDQKMPYMKQVKAPYRLQGKSWVGIAAEYRGTLPGNPCESHYLVLCILTDRVAISFTIAAPSESFANNEGLYRWLLQNHLEIVRIVRSDG